MITKFLEISIIIIVLLFVIYLYTLIWVKQKNIKLKNTEINLKEYEININAVITEDIYSMLDKLISECFSEYIVLNVEYNDIININNELENKINKEVANIISERISPAMISKLSLIYNIDNLSDIIAQKVYLYTLNYTLEKNKIKD